MKNKAFRKYYLFVCLGVFVASFYPFYMGVKVISDVLANGVVMKENYPKYIIPYTPICIALFVGVLLLPICMKRLKSHAFPAGALISTGAFFALEMLFEKKVVIETAQTAVQLEDWQMFMCYTPPGGWGETVTTYKTKTPVEILMGAYNPAFKLHFYVISVILILSILNCLYGFARVIASGDKRRVKALTVQSVASVAFLGLCILACFTAFWRDGKITVSPFSASLMIAFFILLGVVGGIYVGSFLIGKAAICSIGIPALVSSVLTALMYAGEMILLHWHLYRFGGGFLFKEIPGIIFAPIDLVCILASGCATALVFRLLNRKIRKTPSGNPTQELLP